MLYTVGQHISGMATVAECAGGGYIQVDGVIVSAFEAHDTNCYNLILNDHLVTVFEQDVIGLVDVEST